MGAFAGCIISIFSKEVLQSHGLVYWSQSLYQFFLVLAIYFLFLFLQTPNARKKTVYEYLLLFFVCLGALTEWTGYVFGLGISALFWLGLFQHEKRRNLAIKLIIAIAIAVFLTLTHFSLVLGFEESFGAFLNRFLARNTTSGSLSVLLSGYCLSFGAFLFILLCITLIFFLKNFDCINKQNTALFLFVATCIPLIENIIMLQHAGQFSFDRLKFIFPASMIIALGFSRLKYFGKFLLGLLLVVAVYQGYSSYRMDLKNYESWERTDFRNRLLVSAIKQSTDIKCSVFHSNIGVRGYANLLLQRGIYEYSPRQDSAELLKQTHACSAVYLDARWAFTDLQKYNYAIITTNNGLKVKLDFLTDIPNNSPIGGRIWCYDLPFNSATFVVPNTPSLLEQLKPGNQVIFRNGEVHYIKDITTQNHWLYVQFDDSSFCSTETDLSNAIVVRNIIS